MGRNSVHLEKQVPVENVWSCCMSDFYSFALITNKSYLALSNTSYALMNTACGVDLVYWMLWPMQGMLVLVGFKMTYQIPLTSESMHMW